jgi:hypothetical protein
VVSNAAVKMSESPGRKGNNTPVSMKMNAMMIARTYGPDPVSSAVGSSRPPEAWTRVWAAVTTIKVIRPAYDGAITP